MSRADGFVVMDVSTDICNDPKFRRLHRENPEHVALGFMAYMAVLGESWKAGRRVSVTDAWPVITPYSDAVVDAMKAAGLLDRKGMIPVKPWNGWHGPANERRDKARERWRRANDKRHSDSTNDSGVTALLPRGSSDVPRPPSVPLPSAPSVPSAPSDKAKQDGTSLENEPITFRPREAVR